MNLWFLYYTFFKIALFTVGGGLVTIPLIQQELVQTGLLDEQLLYNMIAISQSTPGPIGINLATYIGFEQHGLLGAIVASLGATTPSFIIVTTLSMILGKLNENRTIAAAKIGIRAAAYGLIAAAAANVIMATLFIDRAAFAIDIKAAALFAIILALHIKTKWNMLVFIAIGAVCGLFL